MNVLNKMRFTPAFTLIELLISLAISTGLILIGTHFYKNNVREQQILIDKQRLQEKSQQIMYILRRELKSIGYINQTTYSNSELIFPQNKNYVIAKDNMGLLFFTDKNKDGCIGDITYLENKTGKHKDENNQSAEINTKSCEQARFLFDELNGFHVRYYQRGFAISLVNDKKHGAQHPFHRNCQELVCYKEVLSTQTPYFSSSYSSGWRTRFTEREDKLKYFKTYIKDNYLVIDFMLETKNKKVSHHTEQYIYLWQD